MPTYGMTLEDSLKNDKKCPDLFGICSGESDLDIELKSLVCGMTAPKRADRPNMEHVSDLLQEIQYVQYFLYSFKFIYFSQTL